MQLSARTAASLALAAAALAPAASAARQRASFDFGWRYILGDQGYVPGVEASRALAAAAATTPPAPVASADAGFCGFNVSLSGTQCYGLNSYPAQSQDECEATCCLDPGCLLWQWSSAASGGGCWGGADCSQNTSNGEWTSFLRTSAPAPPGPQPQPPCTDASKPCAQAFDDSAWRTVDTPHDFIVEGVASPNCDRGHGYLCFNKSWYRKTFTVDAALQGQLIWLDFDGVYKNSDMWLNGAWLGHFTSGYVSFRYYLHNATFPNSSTPVLNYGQPNVLSVLVDALTEQEGWFYEGGGITRHVWMNSADPLSITPWGAYFPSVPTGAISSGPLGAMGPQTAASALINAQVDIQNQRAASADTTLVITVMDASGATVATSSTKQTITAGGFARVTPGITWNNVSLWNTESTYMYAVRADVVDNGSGSTIDSVTVPIGVRDAVWTSNQGFVLNGFKVPAKGFSQHQDFAGCGTAVPDRVNEFRIQGIRAIGGNFWRTAHNPTNPELLDFADAHGMLMWVENRFINQGVQPIQGAKDTPRAFPGMVAAADPQLLADAQAMVLRDRNHPSVVIWSLCNEGGCQIGEIAGAVIGTQFKTVINYADTTRPITANGEWSIGTSDTMTNVMDVVTCSYNYGEYTQFHYTHPFKPIMGGESASCTSDRGYYLPTNSSEGHMNSDDDGCVISAWASAAENLWDSGNFVWTGHDYKGEPSPLNWPDINSHFGVLDLAGFEKDTASYYRANWLPTGPTYLQIVPQDWNQPVPNGASVQLRAFTGAAAVEAFVNGVSQGKVSVAPFQEARWGPVPFVPGNISAVAYDASGNVVATSVVATTGAAASIVVTPVAVGPATYKADGQDVALFTVTIVDANGVVVPNARHLLTYSISSGPGTIYALGNGDPADHTPDKVGNPALPYGGVWARPAWMGYARAVVQTQAGKPGLITLSVSSPGLATGQGSFTSA